MGNRVAIPFISVLIIMVCAALLQPSFAHAGVRGQIIKRLCDRQALLGSRLPRPFIAPRLCEPVPEPEPEPEVPTVEIMAEPETIDEGDTATLTWNSEHADSCVASGGSFSGTKAVDGSEDVTPTTTTIYSVECTGDGGSASDSVMVTVNALPEPEAPMLTFTATPTTVLEQSESSATTTLAWTSRHTDSCVASGGWLGDKSTVGSVLVLPSATTTYVLMCEGEGGSVTATTTVGFVPAEPEPEPEVNVVINEIAWMGSMIEGSPEPGAEWIEIRNLGSEPVDVTDWSFAFATTSIAVPDIVSFTGCTHTTIPAGGLYLLARNSAATSTVIADCEYSAGSNTALANTGEIVQLLDASDITVDSVDGSDNWNIGGEPQKGDNESKDTAQRANDGTWFTAAPTPNAENVAL